MKKSILRLALVAALAGGPFVAASARAANNQTAEALPHKVGLIDMAYIFKNYHRFKDLREGLKSEIAASDQKAKAMLGDIQRLQKQIKDPKFKEDSPQKKEWRNQYIEMTTKYQQYRQQEQEKFLEKESGIYKSVYSEVARTVAIYAKHYHYTLILRWNREGVESAKDPKTILARMNRLVIYVHEGQDITDVILDYLNGQYAKGRRTARGPSPRRKD